MATSNPAEPGPRTPPLVAIAAALTLLLALYGIGMFVPGCLVGLFVGPHILIPAILRAVLGGILLIALRGLWHRRRWARWLLILVSVVVALAIAIGRECWLTGSLPAGGGFFLIISALFALITLSLLSRSAAVWCETSS